MSFEYQLPNGAPSGDQLAKLPVYLRSYLTRLENDNAVLHSRLHTLKTGRNPGPIQLGNVTQSMMEQMPGVGHTNEPIYIPGEDVTIKHAGVKLDVSCISEYRPGKEIGVEHDAALRLYFEGIRGDVNAYIKPVSSNCFEMIAVPRTRKKGI